MSAEVELRMQEGSEFHTVGAAMLKPREAKVVRTRGTDKRLVLAERRERVGAWALEVFESWGSKQWPGAWRAHGAPSGVQGQSPW